MKILRIVLILLLPAIGFVGCKKSDNKPKCSSHDSATEPASNEDNNNARYGAPGVSSDNSSTEIVGSGDEDREGGDRKKKTK